MRILISLLFALCLFSVNGFGQNKSVSTSWDDYLANEPQAQKKKFVAKVRLVIDTNDKELETLLYSYLFRELRSIPDIEIVEHTLHSKTWQIIIVALSTTTSAGASQYALGYSYTHDGEFISSGVVLLGKTSVQERCKGLVADLDVQFIEKERRRYQTEGDSSRTRTLATPDEQRLLVLLAQPGTDDSLIAPTAQAIHDVSPQLFTKLLYYLVDVNEELIREYLNEKLKKKIKN